LLNSSPGSLALAIGGGACEARRLVSTPSDISIGSAVFAGLINVTKRQTDTDTYILNTLLRM